LGSIHERFQYWVDNFCPDSYVRGILAEGIRIPVDWSKITESYEEPDNKSAKDNYDFVRKVVARLVEGGQLVEQQLRPRCVNPLKVAIKTNADGGKKLRLVLDLSMAVNLALKDDDYRMTTLQYAINGTVKGNFQVVFDLKSAFHHIPLHPSVYQLMGFQVKQLDGSIKYYYFVVLVFGLKVAAQILGWVLKPVIIFLLQNGIPIVVYIDDGRLRGPTKERTIQWYKFVLDVLDKAGLTISMEKSSKPDGTAQQMEYLGVIIDSNLMCVSASEEKIARLRSKVAETVASLRSMPVKDLTSVVGKLVALEPAFGPSILVGTRIVNIQVTEVAEKFGWKKGVVRLSEGSRCALRRVSASLDNWNGHPIRNADTAITLTSVLAQEGPDNVCRKIQNQKRFAAQFTMASDASDTTVAAYGLNGRLSNFVFTQALLPHEMGLWSALREMSAIHKTLLFWGNVLRMESQASLWWLTDNSAVASIFRKGSGDLTLMRQALQILELARGLNLDLQPVWVSKSDPRLQKADALSKHVNTDDWSVHHDAFRDLERMVGVFTVDLFASAHNYKVNKTEIPYQS
jgi:hypothetical protein